ncbi:hypothetical protein [Nocardia sp. CC227C]|uniref:hypothetical protein n=1 Tax=Nocardia sp. CC227C TaxID=3044562 RepID=UPI00278BF993|nr:hypothetical protein [Nocardia sp. CC227C]
MITDTYVDLRSPLEKAAAQVRYMEKRLERARDQLVDAKSEVNSAELALEEVRTDLLRIAEESR